MLARPLLALSLVELAPVSFPLVHPSIWPLSLVPISLPISPSYMLGGATCIRVNAGAAQVNTHAEGYRQIYASLKRTPDR